MFAGDNRDGTASAGRIFTIDRTPRIDAQPFVKVSEIEETARQIPEIVEIAQSERARESHRRIVGED